MTSSRRWPRSGLLATSLAILVGFALSADGQEAKKAAAGAYPFSFRDVGTETGILPAVAGIRGHGAAWGDADGDGWPELFVATFHNQGSKPGIFLKNEKG